MTRERTYTAWRPVSPPLPVMVRLHPIFPAEGIDWARGLPLWVRAYGFDAAGEVPGELHGWLLASVGRWWARVRFQLRSRNGRTVVKLDQLVPAEAVRPIDGTYAQHTGNKPAGEGWRELARDARHQEQAGQVRPAARRRRSPTPPTAAPRSSSVVAYLWDHALMSDSQRVVYVVHDHTTDARPGILASAYESIEKARADLDAFRAQHPDNPGPLHWSTGDGWADGQDDRGQTVFYVFGLSLLPDNAPTFFERTTHRA